MVLAMTLVIGTEVRRQSTQAVLAQSYQDELKSLQGNWGPLKQGLKFSGRRFEIRSQDGKSLHEGVFNLDVYVEPKEIDFIHTGGPLKGKKWKGIYSLDGNVLKICDNSADLEQPRPVKFESKRDSGHVLITYSRVIPSK